jgi:8-oxo-dGTP pyrophosphatase MutT (NUDIX family)
VTGEPEPQRCVEGYLFVRAPPRILVLRRPPSRGSIWVPVSGKIDPADDGPEAAVRRELVEETGFDRLVDLFELDWAVDFPGPDGRPWSLRGFGVELDAPRAPVLSDEHVAYEWLPPASARSRLHFPDNREAVDRLLERARLRDPGPPQAT